MEQGKGWHMVANQDRTDDEGTPFVLDEKRFDAIVEGDDALAREILEVYLQSSDKLVEALEEAVRNADARAADQAAHSLKGASANIGAEEVALLADRLETMGAAGSMADAVPAMGELRRAYARLRAHVTGLIANLPE